MIVLSEAIYKRRRRLLKDAESGRIAPDAFVREMLDLDPDDFIALGRAGQLSRDRGDIAQAEEYFWKAIEANPTDGEAYLELARVLNARGKPALANGIAELAVLKFARSGKDFTDTIQAVIDRFDNEAVRKIGELPADEQMGLFLYSMEENRKDDPPAVTEKLRALRLIDELQEEEDLSAATVDAIIAEGREIVPLLIGVMRAWAQDYLDDEEEPVMENAVALLGETGGPEEIPPLLELLGFDNETASGVASWAIDRIVKRYPDEAQAWFEANLNGFDMVGLVKIPQLAVHNPDFDPWAKLLGLVGDRCRVAKKDSREEFFDLLLIAMSGRGIRGLAMGREMLSRNGASLAFSARQRCEEFLAALEDGETPRTPPTEAPHTIYEICAGEVSWGIDEDPDGDELPEQPVHVRQLPGRNDPCWCGSGKKYKKCHLDSDASGDTEELLAKQSPESSEFSDLRTRIGEFLRTLPHREVKQAVADFYGDDEATDDDNLALPDWLVHDWIPPRYGHTVLREYIVRNGERLTRREREMAEAWTQSRIGFYEAIDIKPGTGIEVRDLIFGETSFVHDTAMSNSLTKWETFFARVVPGERGKEFTGSGLTVRRPQLETMRAWLDEDRQATGLEWADYLKQNWPRIRRQTFAIAENWMDSLQLRNTNGEELLFCKSTYEVVDHAAALKALRGCNEFEESSNPGDEPSFVWADGNDTMVANIRFEGDHAILEVNSKERLDRTKSLISDAAGESLRHLRDEITTQKALRESAKDRTKKSPGPKPIPREQERELLTAFLDDHYTSWLDNPVPALDGMTPRDAAKTPEGRVQLEELLKLIENGEERKRRAGDAYYDVARLRKELGV